MSDEPVVVDHRRRVERRMDRGDLAQQIARDLWHELRRYLIPPVEAESLRQSEISGLYASRAAAQLIYLCQHYETDTQTDRFQGMEVRP